MLLDSYDGSSSSFDDILLHPIVEPSTNVELLQRIISKLHYDVNKTNEKGETLLGCAFRKRAYEVVKCLVEAGGAELGKLQVMKLCGLYSSTPAQIPTEVRAFLAEHAPEIEEEYRRQVDEFVEESKRRRKR